MKTPQKTLSFFFREEDDSFLLLILRHKGCHPLPLLCYKQRQGHDWSKNPVVLVTPSTDPEAESLWTLFTLH